MTKYIRVDYIVKPEVNLDELKAEIANSSPASAAITRNIATRHFSTQPIVFGSSTLVRLWRKSFRIWRSSPSFSGSVDICRNGVPSAPR